MIAELAAPLQMFTGEFLYWALIFFVLAIVSAIFGFRGVAGLSMGIAKILVVVFIILAVIAVIL